MILDSLTNPQDLKQVPLERLPLLAAEIRQRIIEVVSKTGGHLASSLGAVELAIALHYCLNTPRDKIVWDVGHQSYAHKILTGRNEDFACLRQYEGITGFPCKEESAHDPFTTGHSSTAVSLGTGLAAARDLLPPEQYFKIVAVIGDGSLSGGLCFEGLNNAGHLKKDLMVVLNTNEMSIAPNVGALSNYLNKLISMPIYNRFRESLEGLLLTRVPRGGRLLKLANKFEEGLKGLFVPGLFFEELGFRYFGPFDGHVLNILIPTLKKLLALKGPILLHVVTKKGKGYPPAEKEPIRFHSAAPFVIATGEPATHTAPSYTSVFSKKLTALGAEDRAIVAVTAAMPEGTGLDRFRDAYPARFFDVGIAEGHAVAFAGGLAASGFKPVVAVYSTFLQRAYDQIVECVALQKAPVVFAIDRAGVVGEDGATHQGAFDIAFLRNIPHMTVMAPSDAAELEQMLALAVTVGGPVSLRYPKAPVPVQNVSDPRITLGRAQVVREGDAFAVIALGSMVAPAREAVERLAAEGIQGMLVNARFVKPLDAPLFKAVIVRIKHVFTIEDGVIEGGFGSAVSEATGADVIRLGLPDEFMPCGKREILLDKYGLSAHKIYQTIARTIGVKKYNA